MKSVGEAMAIGRTFPKSLQKALRSLETGLTGFDEIDDRGLGQGDDKNADPRRARHAHPDRLLMVAQALRHGFDEAEIYAACQIDPWFLAPDRGDRRYGGARARARPAGRRRPASAR